MYLYTHIYFCILADSNKAAGGIDDDEAAVRRIVASRTGMAATRGDVNVLGGALEVGLCVCMDGWI